MASLAEVAVRDPADIRNMFTYDGMESVNGATVSVYSVRLFSASGTAQYYTIDTELPTNGYAAQVSNGVLWAALAEKAFAEFDGSYSALNNGNPTTALQAITDKTANYVGINPTNIAAVSNITAAWTAGDLIVLGTTAGGNGIDGNHAYAMVGYNPASSTPFELYNPWGLTSGGSNGYTLWQANTPVGTTILDNNQTVYGGAFYASANLISQEFTGQSTGFGAGVPLLPQTTSPAQPDASLAAAPASIGQNMAASDTFHANSVAYHTATSVEQPCLVDFVDEVLADWDARSETSPFAFARGI